MRQKTRISFLVFLVVAIVACAGTPLLRVSPEVGTVHRYELTQKQKINTSMGAMGSQEVESTTRLEMTQEVRDKGEDGSVTLGVTYDRIRMEMQGPMSMTVDTDAADAAGDDPMAGMMGSLVDKPIVVRMTDRGEILGVEGIESIFDELLSGMPDDPGASAMADTMKKSFGDESLSGLFQQMNPILPEGPVEPGDTWSSDIGVTNPVIGTMDVHYDFQLIGYETAEGRDCAKLGFDYTMKFEGESDLVSQMRDMFRQQGVEVDLSWSFDDAVGSGTIWLDRATGMPVTMDSTTSMKIAINMAMGQGGGQSMSLAMDIVQDQHLAPID